MAIVKDYAQVLRIHEFGNSSLILVLLCKRMGQVRVLAKGSRRSSKKGFEGGFDLLTRGEILLYPRGNDGLWIFKEWEEHNRPQNTKEPLEFLQATSFLCELTEAFTKETLASESDAEGLPHRAGDSACSDLDYQPLFENLAQAVDQLTDHARPGHTILFYILTILEWSGFLPSLTTCSRCEKPFANGHNLQSASFDQGGLECEACGRLGATETSGRNITSQRQLGLHSLDRPVLVPEALGALAYLKRTGKPVRLSAQAAQNASRVMVAMIHHALERDLRTIRIATREIQGLCSENQSADIETGS